MDTSRCPGCDQKFSRPATLRRHVETVHQNNRLTCEECPKTFSRKDLLERHRKSHRGSGKLPCTICSRTFRPDYLLEHVNLCERATNRRCAKIRATLGIGNVGVLAAPTRPIRLRWDQTPSDTGHESLSPSATAQADGLRVVPSVYSYKSLPTRLLVEHAKAAIANHDSVHFDSFVQDLDTAGTTLEALQASMRKFCTPDEPYIPFLVVAAQRSAPAIVECLVKNGLNVNDRDDDGMTAMHHAKDDRIIRTLIDAGADVNAPESRYEGCDWTTPLFLVVADRDLARAATLLDAGARLNHFDVASSVSSLGLAIRRQDNSMFECLLLDAHIQDLALDEILVEVVIHGTAVMTSFLLGQGADVQLFLTQHPYITHELLLRAADHPVHVQSQTPYRDAAEKVRLLNLDHNSIPASMNALDMIPRECAASGKALTPPLTRYGRGHATFEETQISSFPSSSKALHKANHASVKLHCSTGLSTMQSGMNASAHSLPSEASVVRALPRDNFPYASMHRDIEFPVCPPSMETSVSANAPSTSVKDSFDYTSTGGNPMFPAQFNASEHPVLSNAVIASLWHNCDVGTYTCTYHGCTRRFDSHTELQRHKRDYHRATATATSESATPGREETPSACSSASATP